MNFTGGAPGAHNYTGGGGGALYYRCTEVTALCPVERTTLGYFPNKGINIFFAVGFAIAAVMTLVFGTWKRTWSYMAFIAAGSVLELAGLWPSLICFVETYGLTSAQPGYVGRVLLADNPWNQQAFETQICAIILAPTLICISIYLTLKHICLSLSPELSRIKPRLYPFIFVPLDVSCLLVQAIGGALAASAGRTNFKLLQNGNRAIIAGIVLQVVVLLFFGIAMIDYYIRVKKWIRSPEADAHAVGIWKDKKFRIFVYAVLGAYSLILIRCIYR